MSYNSRGRYERNGQCINERHQHLLGEAKVCVLGCGGLGGYIIEMLVRAGVGELTVVDGDTFELMNLNRQLLSTPSNLGRPKAEVAAKRIKTIDDNVKVNMHKLYIDEKNGSEILKGHDLIMDALDALHVRKKIVSICDKLGIAYIYGAIAGWYGQVATILPNSNTKDVLFRYEQKKGKETQLGNTSFTPALVASVQVSEAVKYLTQQGENMTNGFIHIDLLNNDFEKIDFEK